jgi:hypothetical protein
VVLVLVLPKAMPPPDPNAAPLPWLTVLMMESPSL